MCARKEDVIYYLTVQNEPYAMPDMPEGCEEGILKGMYRCRASLLDAKGARAHLLASGSILNEAQRAQQILETDYGVAADVWSITSFQQLHRDGADVERWNLRNPDREPRMAHVQRCLGDTDGTYVVASDYVKALPDAVARWFPRPPVSLGTDGFGRSDSRQALRRHFEVDGRTMAFAALSDLTRQGAFELERLRAAQRELDIDADKVNPVLA